jgi:outer membrane usher protein
MGHHRYTQLGRSALWCATLVSLCWLPGVSPLRAENADISVQEVVIGLTLNSQTDQEMVIALRGNGMELWLATEDLQRWRVRHAELPAQTLAGREYRRVDQLPGATVSANDAQATLVLNLPPGSFDASRFAADPQVAPAVTPAATGAFLNYQLSGQRISGNSFYGAYGEVGLFNRAGVFTSTGVIRQDSGIQRMVRLDTAFTRDFRDRLQTLVVGDTISDGGSWGNALRYGGLHFGSNFALRPDLITMPLLTLSGNAVVPSTVDIFINDQRVSQQGVPPGPFVLDRTPSVTGAGELRMVVRDALGREQVITQSFYASTRLLAAGLDQFSIDVGKARRFYAVASSDYGAFLTAARYRRAFGPRLTLEAHGEYLRGDAHAVGVNVAVGLNTAGVLNLTLAHGAGETSSGNLYGIGIEHMGRRLNLLLGVNAADEGYRQMGDAATIGGRYRVREVAQAGLTMGRAGTLALAAAHQTYTVQPATTTVSMSYSSVLLQRAALGVTLARQLGDFSNTSIYATFTMALESRRSASLLASGAQGSAPQPDEVYAMTQLNPPAGPGVGYRVGVSTQGNYDSAFHWNTPRGDLQLQAARTVGVSGQSAYWSGAATLLGGAVHATRSVYGSFGLVDLDGLADVPVYVDHQLIAHTDRSGRALIYDLRPYETNRVNIEPLELPLDTSIGAHTLVLVPAFRSGVIARFPVTHQRGALFTLVDVADVPLAPGSDVQIGAQHAPVALEGKVYLENVLAVGSGAGLARWPNGSCRFKLPPLPGGADPLPDLGVVHCAAEAGGAP